MTRAELHALVDAQFDNLQNLQNEASFLTFEEKFTRIWLSLGTQVLQATVGDLPENPRKKTPVKPGLVQ